MNSCIYINPPYCYSRASFLRCQELHSYHREIKRFNVMTLACASIFANGFCMTWGERKSWELSEYPKARFEKRGAGGRKRSGFPLALPVASPKEGISVGCAL